MPGGAGQRGPRPAIFGVYDSRPQIFGRNFNLLKPNDIYKVVQM